MPSFRFFLDADRFLAETPMLLHYQINNNHRVYEMAIMSEHKNASWLELRLYDAEGNLVPAQADGSLNSQFYRDGIPVRPDETRRTAGGFGIMPGGYLKRFVPLNNRYPLLKPGKYRLSIRASLIVTQARPPDESLSSSQKAIAAKEASLPPPITKTVRGGAVIRFTVLPIQEEALKAQESLLQEQLVTGQTQEAMQALQKILIWPKSFAPSVWRTVLKDPHLDRMRLGQIQNKVCEAAYKGDSNAIAFLAFMVWDAKIPSARPYLMTARSRGNAQVQRQIDALFTVHKEEINKGPSGPFD